MPSNKKNLGITRDPAQTTTRQRNLRRDLTENAGPAMESAKELVIEQPTTLSVGLEITGTADLIQNKFSQKSVEQMLKKHMGISVQRETKKPREVLEDATIYNLDRKVAMPPTGLKLAMINAASQVKGLKKTQLRIALFVQGNSLPIEYDEMIPRMDICRTSGIGRVPDVRFRPSFRNWKARVIVLFSDTLSVQTVVDLVNRAGQVGIGEWRPEKNGTFGTFRVTRHISDAAELGEVEAICASPLESLRIPDWALDMNLDPELISRIFSDQSDNTRGDEEPVEVPTGASG